MKFRIDQKIFEKFKGVNIGVVIVKNLRNTGDNTEIQAALRKQEKRIKDTYKLEDLGSEPNIAVWRKAYADFGAKPKEHKSSVENLYRLILEGLSLRHVNNLVDIYNLISLKYTLPVGGEDLDQIQGDILLTFATDNELPVLLLGDKDPRSPKLGEVIYKDQVSTICRRWNWREVSRTKLTQQTQNCILVIEGLLPISQSQIRGAIKELKTLVEKYCGGNSTVTILDESHSKIQF